MAQVYLGSLMLVPYNFAPRGWALCQGQSLQIAANTALFSLLGVAYGGNGTTNFLLPNLQGNIAIGMGQSSAGSYYSIGQASGSPTVTLSSTDTPPHNHNVMGTTAPANQPGATNGGLARTGANIYTDAKTPLVSMNPNLVVPFGGNGPHNNMMPYTTMNWIIALEGLFPPRG
jgi:microcystin-dependent protein